VDILAVIDDIAQVDSHAKIQLVRCQTSLHRYRAVDGIQNSRKFNQESVTRKFDNFSRMTGNRWIDHLFPGPLPGRHGAVRITFHMPGIFHHIGRQNGRKSALVGLISHLPSPGKLLRVIQEETGRFSFNRLSRPCPLRVKEA
jgi:hypothetical protein